MRADDYSGPAACRQVPIRRPRVVRRRRRAPRLPLAPLVALLELPSGWAIFELAALVDVHRRQVERWIAEGGLTIATADRQAARLGRTALDVWGPDYEAACAVQWPKQMTDAKYERWIREPWPAGARQQATA